MPRPALAVLGAAPLLAALLLVGAGASGCREEPSGKSEIPPAGPLRRYAGMPAPAIRFEDVSAGSGIRVVNHSGRAGVKEFLLEAVGPGPAWFDYDRDGLLDCFIPDGDVFSNYRLVRETDPQTGALRPYLRPKSPRPERFKDQLWRNNGDGTFTDVAEKAGVADENWSFGATTFDFDADGLTDVFVANQGPCRLWHNNGNGTFTDVAVAKNVAGLPETWATCAGVGDLDGDDRLDLYVGAYADTAAEIDRQRADRKLPEDQPVESISGRSCHWQDVLAYCGPIGLVGQHDTCYRQAEDGTFEDVSVAWGMRPPVARYAFTVLVFDFNEDGLTDVYVANDSVESFFWQQDRDSEGRVRFQDTSEILGVKFGLHLSPQAGMGATVVDANQDGRMDIFKTNFSQDYSNLYLMQRVRPDSEAFYFKDRGHQSMGQEVHYDLKWGCGFYDFDNDTDEDLLVANGHVYKEVDLRLKTGSTYEQWNALFECVDPAAVAYREIGAKPIDRKDDAPANLDAGGGMWAKKCFRAAAFADFNNDGFVDVLLGAMNDAPTLLLNTTTPSPDRGFVKLTLSQPGGNREALGAIVEVTAGGKTRRYPNVRVKSFLGCDDPRIHVGLGKATTCDVRVIWPGRDRATTEYKGLAANAHWRLDRASGKAEAVELKAFRVPR
jgi:hypothetical protein